VKRIRGAVDAQLQAKGRHASDSPDFLHRMQLSGKTTHGGSVGVGVSVGIPVGRRGGSPWRRKEQAHREEKGTLVLDFLDARPSRCVAATASERSSRIPPEQQQNASTRSFARLLSYSHPRKKPFSELETRALARPTETAGHDQALFTATATATGRTQRPHRDEPTASSQPISRMPRKWRSGKPGSATPEHLFAAG